MLVRTAGWCCSRSAHCGLTAVSVASAYPGRFPDGRLTIWCFSKPFRFDHRSFWRRAKGTEKVASMKDQGFLPRTNEIEHPVLRPGDDPEPVMVPAAPHVARLTEHLRERRTRADLHRDLPPGHKRRGWKKESLWNLRRRRQKTSAKSPIKKPCGHCAHIVRRGERRRSPLQPRGEQRKHRGVVGSRRACWKHLRLPGAVLSGQESRRLTRRA